MSEEAPAKTETAPRWHRYPAYKPSGIEWLGEIPAHWEMRRLKMVSSVRVSNVDKKSVEGQSTVRLCNYVDVYKNEKITQAIDYMTATATQQQVDQYLLRRGDVIITKDSETWDDIAVPALVSEDFGDVVCGYHLALIRPNQSIVDGRYLFRLFQAPALNYQFSISANGVTRFGLPTSAITDSWFCFPTLFEQRAIAAFLDRETAKIDALIAKKERLIELLREKRTALITHAVTKGLDPSVPMKDSGIEWLGEIPAHWEIKRLKYVVKNGLVNGVFKKQDQFGSGVKLINVFDIYRDDFLINFESLERVEVDQEEIQRYKVEDGDIFFVRSSLKLEGVATSACTIGVSEPIVFECHIIRARPDVAKAIPKFLISYLNSKLARQRLIALSETVTMTTIDQNNLQSTEILVPPLDEQITIIGFLDRETSRIDRLIAKVREGIERLKVYRTALISAAVTGKIDVRKVA